MFSHTVTSLHTLWRDDPGEFCHKGLFWTFWLSLASFPIGYGAREVLPLVALVFLLGYYRFSWHKSVLANLPIRWIFLCPLVMSCIGIVFSSDIWESLLHVGRGINKGFILPFIAMECAGSEKDLRRLVWASVIACFWQGLDGIWQACTGFDFIFGYPMHSGRLTGSLGDYDVGNYIAMALVPAIGVWHILQRSTYSIARRCFWLVLLLGPAIFLLNGAGTRSGMLSLTCAFTCYVFLQFKNISFPRILSVGALFLMIFFAFWVGQHAFPSANTARLGPNVVKEDGRWGYWQTAFKIVQANPWLGAGAGRFRDTFERLDIAPAKDAENASHPHNLFLDILYAHGGIGFTLGMIFLLGSPLWCYRRIRALMRHEMQSVQHGISAHLACCFLLGYVSWLINGIFGHDFYRIWYLAIAMSYLGIALGAAVTASKALSRDAN